MPAPAVIGGIIKGVLALGNKAIDKFVPDKDLAAKLKHELAMSLQEDNQEFRVLVEQLEADMFKAQQETIQAELHQSDLYTKRTRPKIARVSFYGGLVLILLSSMPEGGVSLPFLGTFKPWNLEWQVLMLLYSPALTYMGVRGFEKWRAGGSS